MRDVFPSFYRPTNADFDELWKSALIVFDTSVLLNLYRYRQDTTSALLEVMEKVSDRIWIPFHVGLEYQLNRLSVISDQHNKFTAVRGIIEKSVKNLEEELNKLQLAKRHTHIDPSKFMQSIKECKDKFLKELTSQEERSTTITSQDSIRTRLDALFASKVGHPPKSQDEVDKMSQQAKERFSKKTPPGYLDQVKADGELDTFVHQGLTYNKSNGDYYIWHQMLAYLAAQKTDNVIFLTDDTKEDWWLKVKDGAEKTVGPRPELIEEVRAKSNVVRFHIYTTESFLKHANTHLNTNVSQAALDDVRELSKLRIVPVSTALLQQNAREKVQAVLHWLNEVHCGVIENLRGYPDFEYTLDGRVYGVEAIVVRSTATLAARIVDHIRKAEMAVEEQGYEQIKLALVISDEVIIPKINNITAREISRVRDSSNGKVEIIFGTVSYSERYPTGLYVPITSIFA